MELKLNAFTAKSNQNLHIDATISNYNDNSTERNKDPKIEYNNGNK